MGFLSGIGDWVNEQFDGDGEGAFSGVSWPSPSPSRSTCRLTISSRG